jgi:hypothetical protein
MRAPEASISFWFIAAGTVLVETALLLAIISERLSLLTGGALHLALVTGLSLWVYFSRVCRQDLRMPLLLATATCFMGPLGAIGSLVTFIFAKVYSRSATPFEEWYAALFPDTQLRPETELWQDILLAAREGEQTSVAPFSDILFFGNLAQKQELIALVSKNFQPVFAPVLRMALNDSNNAIRVQAASAITRIEDEFLKRSLALSSAAHQKRDDPGLLWKLARLNDDYANAGILDHERERESRKRAGEAYEEYLRLRPGHIEAHIAVARLLLRSGQHAEAARGLENLIDREDAPTQLVLLYMEALYGLGKFEDLRTLAHQKYSEIAAREDTTVEARDMLKLWTGAA